MGVYAKYDGKKIHVGKKKFLEKFSIKIEKTNGDVTNKIFVCIDKKPVGLITLRDTLKDPAKELVRFLEKRKSEVIMLTGDNKKIADEIGKELGIEKIFSEVTPENKLEIIQKLREKYIEIETLI